jgi:tRNA1Val (adenine37-N6)-methyltransferase
MNQPAIEKVFNFKQFSIVQSGCGMPVSTDGVMLGAWFTAQPGHRILDIGCGTGLLSLMAAQRFEQAKITAIEIDPHAIQVAQYNIQHSAWSGRITAIQQDILQPEFKGQFDSIVCNPPYFTSGETARSQSRATARHTLCLTHENLVDRCAHLLTPDGRASFILPLNEADAMIDYAQSHGWYLTRYCQVQPTPAKPISRILFELARPRAVQAAPQLKQESLIIQQNGHYSAEFIQLTRAFYLKM